jgi:hypothetical protein
MLCSKSQNPKNQTILEKPYLQTLNIETHMKLVLTPNPKKPNLALSI